MVTTLILSLVLGCQQKCPECEPVARACPDGQRCAKDTDDARIQLGTLNHPIGDGPTEIWKGPELVGVGFRKNGVEDIVMFTTALSQGTSPCASPTLQVNAYPAYLSPHHTPQGSGADVLTFKPLERCDAAGALQQCSQWDCFSNAAAFLHPATGVFNIIGERIGQPASYVSDPAKWRRARGSIPAFSDFGVAECVAQTSFYELSESHADRAVNINGGQTVGWEFIGLWGEAGGPQEALVVFKKPLKQINNLRHEDMPLTDSNGNGLGGDDWCQYVDAQCPLDVSGAATCWMSLIAFNFPL